MTDKWRTETAEKVAHRHWDAIQDLAENAGERLGWLRNAAMKEDLSRAEGFAGELRDTMSAIMERLTRLDAIREMRDVYEITHGE